LLESIQPYLRVGRKHGGGRPAPISSRGDLGPCVS